MASRSKRGGLSARSTWPDSAAPRVAPRPELSMNFRSGEWRAGASPGPSIDRSPIGFSLGRCAFLRPTIVPGLTSPQPLNLAQSAVRSCNRHAEHPGTSLTHFSIRGKSAQAALVGKGGRRVLWSSPRERAERPPRIEPEPSGRRRRAQAGSTELSAGCGRGSTADRFNRVQLLSAT